jgi:CMP-N-acetylneuraminic acid synthetase|tara:strand:- start:4635 stop:5297 length:663 start_codon:yes stop_codon:yes gene_type:complete
VTIEITAVIPTRAGSERIIDKNTKNFCDSSLLQIKINQMKALKELEIIDDIIVNTNCKKSIKIAKNNKIKTLIRDEYFARSECLTRDYWANVGTNIETNTMLLSQVTSPMTSIDTYRDAINSYEGQSVMSATKVKDFLWMGKSPLNYKMENQPRSQDLPDDVFKLNFAIAIIGKKELLEYGNLVTPETKFIYLSEIEGFDIDTELDFKIAEILYSEQLIN